MRIDDGFYGDENLSGLNVGLVLEIPVLWQGETGKLLLTLMIGLVMQLMRH